MQAQSHGESSRRRNRGMIFASRPSKNQILFFKRGRSEERRKRVLIVNGEREYVRGQPNQLDENVQRLVTTVERFTDLPGFCRVVTSDEIQKQGWDLRPGCYMQTTSRGKQSSNGTVFLDDQPTPFRDRSGYQPADRSCGTPSACQR